MGQEAADEDLAAYDEALEDVPDAEQHEDEDLLDFEEELAGDDDGEEAGEQQPDAMLPAEGDQHGDAPDEVSPSAGPRGDVSGAAEQPGSGKKVIDLTKSSGRLQKVEAAPARQQQKQQQQQEQQQRQPEPGSSKQSSRRDGQQQPQQPQGHAAPPGRLGPFRYFMLKSVNEDNWALARERGCWATQPRNEAVFGAALKAGCSVVLFLSVNGSGAIQGYGRMTSRPGDGPPSVPWLDITDEVNNFTVSWDCQAPLAFEAVRNLMNPWAEPNMGPKYRGPGLPLNRHRDGQELAPRIGEQLVGLMNRAAQLAGKPVTGPLASGVPGSGSQFSRPAPAPPGPAGRLPAGPYAPPGLGGRPGPPPGRLGPAGMPGPRGGLHQPPPPPPRGMPAGGWGGMPVPRGLARFAGRLEGLPGPPSEYDGFAPAGYRRPGSPEPEWPDRHRDSRRSRHSRSRSRERHGRSRERERHRARDARRSKRSRSGSRSRSAERGREGRRNRRGERAEEEEEEEEAAPADSVTYEDYLAAYDKVQQRLKKLASMGAGGSAKSGDAGEAEPRPRQLIVATGSGAGEPGGGLGRAGSVGLGGEEVADSMSAGGPGYAPQAMAAAGGAMLPAAGRGAGAGRGGVMRPHHPPGGMAGRPGGMGAGAAGPKVPTLEEYSFNLKAKYAERGLVCPHSEETIRANYYKRLAQVQQQQQQQQVQPGAPQLQPRQGMGPGPMQQPPQHVGAAGGMGLRMGRAPGPAGGMMSHAAGLGPGGAAPGMQGGLNPMLAAAAMNPMLAAGAMMAASGMLPMAMGLPAAGMGMGMGMGMGGLQPGMGLGPGGMQGGGMPGPAPGRGMRGRGGRGRGRLMRPEQGGY